MELSDLKIRHKNLASRVRRIARMLDGSNFEYAWDQSNKDERARIFDLIAKSSYPELQEWLQAFDDFEDFSLRELRAIASQNYIKYYSRLTKGQLIAKFISRGIKPAGYASESSGRDEAVPSGGGSSGEANRAEVEESPDWYLGYGI